MAAQAAAKRGVPALAASQGLTDQPDFPGGVQLVTEWVQAHRAALLAGTAPLQVVEPQRADAHRRNRRTPWVSTSAGNDITKVDCNGTGPVTDDVTAFVSGHATLSELPPAA
ncbi:MAG: hypothetical protein R2726_19425 [Acidimicrobiales bacterium]